MLKKVWKETNGSYSMLFQYPKAAEKNPNEICASVKKFIEHKTGFKPLGIVCLQNRRIDDVVFTTYFVGFNCQDLQIILMTWNDDRNFLCLLDRMLEHLHEQDAGILLRSAISDYETADLDGEFLSPQDEVKRNF